MSEHSLMTHLGGTRRRPYRDAERKTLNTGFAPTTTAAEVTSGVSLEDKVAVTGRRRERV
jgi:hypothetical protein